MRTKNTTSDALRDALMHSESEVPVSRMGRLWRFGRSAAGMAGAVLGGKNAEPTERELKAMARLVSRVGELKGVAMKIGQIFSYIDPTMPEELRSMLAVLQTSSQASPWSSIEATLREAFGPRAGELLARLDREPVAVASIAQVHRAELGLPVAVKIRHPGIVDALRHDFATARSGAALGSLLVPGAAGTVASNVEEASTAMLEECDLALEAERQATFGRLFAGDDIIAVPRVIREWCAPSVLTSEWLSGRSLDAWLADSPTQAERNRLGIALFRFYIGTLYRHGLFHADPHPGNYAVLDDDRLVIYDFGCVRSFDAPSVAAFAALVEATRRDEREGIRSALAALGATPPKEVSHLRTLLRGFFAPLLVPGPHRIEPGAGYEARVLFRDKRALMQLSLPGKLLFLFRLRFGLYAILSRIGAVADWAELESGWANERKCLRERPSVGNTYAF
jgi:predicted unusual protein kinase regulating ubiquinone biosynthesis (AarF/ABC1/UbiB family)